MKKEEIIKEIEKKVNEYAERNLHYEYISNIIICICIFLSVIWVIILLWHNSDVDKYNKQLQFCKDIHNSDNVILEQCKEYFVIMNK